jgi:hypothetical protein
MQDGWHDLSFVIAGLDPAINFLCKTLFAKRMDQRVKPAGDAREWVSAEPIRMGTAWDNERAKRARGRLSPDRIAPEMRRGCGGAGWPVCCYRNTTSFVSTGAPFKKTMTSCEEPPS